MAILKSAVSERSCCSSQKANIFAYNVSGQTVPANGAVSYDTIAESHGFVAPGVNGNATNQFTVLCAGTYQYDYSLSGQSGTASPLAFYLSANGSSLPSTVFKSQDIAPGGNTQVITVSGFGIVTVPALTTIQVMNATGAFASPVTLTSFPTGALGSPLAINAAFRMVKICG